MNLGEHNLVHSTQCARGGSVRVSKVLDVILTGAELWQNKTDSRTIALIQAWRERVKAQQIFGPFPLGGRPKCCDGIFRCAPATEHKWTSWAWSEEVSSGRGQLCDLHSPHGKAWFSTWRQCGELASHCSVESYGKSVETNGAHTRIIIVWAWFPWGGWPALLGPWKDGNFQMNKQNRQKWASLPSPGPRLSIWQDHGAWAPSRAQISLVLWSQDTQVWLSLCPDFRLKLLWLVIPPQTPCGFQSPAGVPAAWASHQSPWGQKKKYLSL